MSRKHNIGIKKKICNKCHALVGNVAKHVRRGRCIYGPNINKSEKRRDIKKYKIIPNTDALMVTESV